jgi:hypothetical protein
MPLRIFNDRTAISGFSTSFLQGFVMWCYTYYLIVFVRIVSLFNSKPPTPFRLQLLTSSNSKLTWKQFLGALQHSLFHSALETMSVGAYIAPSAIVGAVIIKKTMKFKLIIIIGWVLLGVGMGVNVTMHPHSSKAVLYGPRCVAAIGAGLLFPTPLFAVQANQQPNDIGIATSTQVFSRSLGTTFGVAIGGVIFQNRWSKLLPGLNLPAEFRLESNLAEVGYEIIANYPESVQEIYRDLYSKSLDMVWWVMVAVSITGLLGAFIARNDTLRSAAAGKQESKRVSRTNDEEKAEEVLS